MINFNFPATIFSKQNDSDTQLDHVLSEAVEVANAENHTEEELEMVDLTHSAETYWRAKIREKGEAYVHLLFDMTIEKNDDRDYYLDGEV